MTFKQYIESGKDTNTWPIFLKEMVTDTYMNFNLLYSDDRTNSMIRNLILGSKFDIAKQEELLAKYEDIMKQENWGATQDSTSEGTSESNSIGKMFERGISTEGEFTKDSSDNKGLAKNTSTNKQVDNLNTFIALNATELNNLYRNVIGSFSSLFQMTYVIGEESSGSVTPSGDVDWGNIGGDISDQRDLMNAFEVVGDELVSLDSKIREKVSSDQWVTKYTQQDTTIANIDDMSKTNKTDIGVLNTVTVGLNKDIVRIDKEIDTIEIGKQDKLIAGTNITISGNTISASGGGSTPTNVALLDGANTFSKKQTFMGPEASIVLKEYVGQAPTYIEILDNTGVRLMVLGKGSSSSDDISLITKDKLSITGETDFTNKLTAKGAVTFESTSGSFTNNKRTYMSGQTDVSGDIRFYGGFKVERDAYFSGNGIKDIKYAQNDTDATPLKQVNELIAAGGGGGSSPIKTYAYANTDTQGLLTPTTFWRDKIILGFNVKTGYTPGYYYKFTAQQYDYGVDYYFSRWNSDTVGDGTRANTLIMDIVYMDNPIIKLRKEVKDE